MKKQNKTKTLQPFRDIGSISLHSLLAGVFDAIGFVYKNEQGTQRRTKNYSKDFFLLSLFSLYLFLFHCMGVLPSCFSVFHLCAVSMEAKGVTFLWDWNYRWQLAR